MGYRLGNSTVSVSASSGKVWNSKLNKLGLYTASDIKFSSTGTWVVAQHQNMSFAVETGLLKTSTDSSVTFPNTYSFTDANKIRQAVIWDDGTINFFTRDNRAYITDTTLATVTEIFVKEADGTTNMTFHTPANSTYPGWYFEMFCYQPMGYRDTVRAFTNYGNAYESGAQPTNIYASSDNGATWRRVYQFGQNLRYRDDGTSDGGTTGTLLGDSGNTNVCRHGHSLNYIPSVGKWLLLTGDHHNISPPTNNEIGWYWLTEAEAPNPWTAERIDFGYTIETTDHLKAFQTIEHDGYVYWASDNQEAGDTTENGIWRAPTATLDDPTTHRQIFTVYEDVSSSIRDFRIDTESGIILGMIEDNYTPTVTAKRLFCITEFGLGKVSVYKDSSADFKRLSDKNSDGYYLMDYEGRIPLQSKSFFIRIGNDLLDNL